MTLISSNDVDVSKKSILNIDIHDDVELDLDFYQSWYSDLGHLSEHELLTHWLDYGHREDRYSNFESLLNSMNIDLEGLPNDFLSRDNTESTSGLKSKYHEALDFILKEKVTNDNSSITFSYESLENNEIFIINKYLDINYYRSQYEDVLVNNLNPVEHYFFYGWLEGRNPNEWFSTTNYLRAYPDVEESKLNPLSHYILIGQREGYDPSPDEVALQSISEQDDLSSENNDEDLAILKEYLDREFYLEEYPDIKRNNLDPVEHYYAFGWKEGRNPTSWFSTNKYLQMYSDVEISGCNPFVHYLLYGKAEDRVATCVNDFENRLMLNKDARFGDPRLKMIIDYPSRQLLPQSNYFDKTNLSIHWVIPDFSPGGGGHMTIFRMVRWLELFGHDCHIWVINFKNNHEYDLENTILQHYQTLKAPVKPLENQTDNLHGDIIIATGWETVAPTMNATNFKERFYFVQDYEPYFFPRGTYSLLAEDTYNQDLACICASPWLSQLLSSKHERWAKPFWLAYNQKIYYEYETSNSEALDNAIPRIAVYARMGTSRRCVELAIVALEALATQGFEFIVDFYGGELSFSEVPFQAVSHGILKPHELAELYNSSTLGLCFSGTNYSLVPQEMMACGLPVVEIDVENTRAIFPEGVVTFSGPQPGQIADELKELLLNEERREKQRISAKKWVSKFSWESSAKMIENAFFDRLTEKGYKCSNKVSQKKSLRHSKNHKIKASIIIPTYNAMPDLPKIFEAIENQRTNWEYEIAVIDSSSTDGTFEFLEQQDNLILKQIEQSDFDHGQTRNEIIELTKGEFIVAITQDALPTNEFWLYNLVTTLERFPKAAGVFGKHIAHPNASPFTKRDLAQHFAMFEDYPVVVSKQIDQEKWLEDDPSFRQMLHFYSDNNSCMRRVVWQDIPYPKTAYGEDQLWANMIIEAGYEKAYAKDAVVFHSHDYEADETEKRAATEARFFKDYFDYSVVDSQQDFEELLLSLNESDELWAKQNGINQGVLRKQIEQNYAKLRGYYSIFL